jgi:hypothetical protein
MKDVVIEDRSDHRRTRLRSPLALSHLGLSSIAARPGGFGRLMHGSNSLETRPGSLELQNCTLLVSLDTVRVCQPHASECRLIGRADLVPEMHSLLKVMEGVHRVTVGQLYPSACERRAGYKRLAFEPRSDA